MSCHRVVAVQVSIDDTTIYAVITNFERKAYRYTIGCWTHQGQTVPKVRQSNNVYLVSFPKTLIRSWFLRKPRTLCLAEWAPRPLTPLWWLYDRGVYRRNELEQDYNTVAGDLTWWDVASSSRTGTRLSWHHFLYSGFWNGNSMEWIYWKFWVMGIFWW